MHMLIISACNYFKRMLKVPF